MSVLGIDLGATKLASAVFTTEGKILSRKIVQLENRKGSEVGILITSEIENLISSRQYNDPVVSIGIGVPGISRHQSGTVWAPNIPGWEDYPLLKEVQEKFHAVPVILESDRACYISGELWQGNAKGCSNAIYLSVGTGIGAGILIDGVILRGAHDIAGAIGWMALQQPFQDKYKDCGCFEYHASGEGIAKVAREILLDATSSTLKKKPAKMLTAHDVFDAFEHNDEVACKVIQQAIHYWGMAVANLVSLFNPEKIILGGGVFGPASKLISAIKTEAARWAQPISMTMVKLETSKLGSDAGMYGAGYLALKKIKE